MSGTEYEEIIHVADGITIRFVDAGHLLGSSSVEIWISEAGIDKKLVFSGDIGNVNQPIIRDPHYIKEADYVVMESTYGDRSHGPRPDYISDLAAIIQRTFDRGGNVVIRRLPSAERRRCFISSARSKKKKRVKITIILRFTWTVRLLWRRQRYSWNGCTRTLTRRLPS